MSAAISLVQANQAAREAGAEAGCPNDWRSRRDQLSGRIIEIWPDCRTRCVDAGFIAEIEPR